MLIYCDMALKYKIFVFVHILKYLPDFYSKTGSSKYKFFLTQRLKTLVKQAMRYFAGAIASMLWLEHINLKLKYQHSWIVVQYQEEVFYFWYNF